MAKTRSDIRKLDQEFLGCRDLGHAWSELDPKDWGPDVRKPSFGWLRLFDCVRCGTQRRQLINTYGEVETTSYNYPDGYQLEEWTPAKAPFRKEIARRRGIRIRKYREN